MAWRSMPRQIASRSRSSAMMDPGAPLKVKWYQVGAGALRITIPGVRWAVTISSSVPTPAASIALFCRAGMTAAASSTRNVIESSRGLAPHQLRIAGQHDALRGPVDRGHDERSSRRAGRVELALVEDVRVRRHAAGLHPAGEHRSPLGVRLGEGDHRLAIVNAPGHRLHAIEPGSAGDQVPLVAAAARVDLAP